MNRYTIATLALAAGLAVGCSNDRVVDKSSPQGGGNALDVDTPQAAVDVSAARSGQGGTAGGGGGKPVVGSAGGTGGTGVNAMPPAELNRTPATTPTGEMQ